ncbi:hypothetical protein ACQP2T_54580 [Nonomuraea sp. CA-143628]|uniref:hypothetical protein n=1 Tax=Nonomuraea sp. CA-143628 TaxID=3239997 RepID=UPI003D941A84
MSGVLKPVSWQDGWVSHPLYAERMPFYLRTLQISDKAEDLDNARFGIDHAVALGHRLYVGAYHAIPALLELLATCPPKARIRIYDVLTEIALSEPAEPEPRVIDDKSGAEIRLTSGCHGRLKAAMPQAWEDIASTDEAMIFAAMDFIAFVDDDKDRFIHHLKASLSRYGVRCRENAQGWLEEYDN